MINIELIVSSGGSYRGNRPSWPVGLISNMHKGLKMLTDRDLLALTAILEEAIIKSQQEDDGDPIFHEISVNSVNPFDSELIQSEVYASLGKKGLIQCSGSEDESGNEMLEYV